MTPLEFKLWRVARGWTQADAAEFFKVSQAAVSAWERQPPVVVIRPRLRTTAVPDWVVEQIANRFLTHLHEEETEESDPAADRGDWEFHRDHDQ